MYSFAQRSDTAVFDEPLYAHYLTNSTAHEYHPGSEEVIATQDNNGMNVINNLMLGDHNKPVPFFKHMTHHLVDLDWSFMDQTVNVFLTRNPEEMLPSYFKQVKQPAIHDTGYPQHHELLQYLRDRGQNPPILDSTETLKNPRAECQPYYEELAAQALKA